jgi:hypothetical protein
MFNSPEREFLSKDFVKERIFDMRTLPKKLPFVLHIPRLLSGGAR